MSSNKTVIYSPISEKCFPNVSTTAYRHLLNSLASLERGTAPTPSFKLYGKSDWSLVEQFLDSIDWKDPKNPKWLLEYELSRKSKFGPQGGFAPWSELKENAEMYFTCPTECKVKAELIEIYHMNLQKLSIQEALNTLKNDDKIQSRAAGWRDYNLKKTDPVAQQHAVADARSGIWRQAIAYFFSRYNKKKKRLFVPMPFSSMILQAQYFNPFLKAIQHSLRADGVQSPYLFWGDKIGFDFLFHTIMQTLLQGYDPSHIVWCMRDFEKMDTTTGKSQKKNLFVPKLARAYNIKRDSAGYREMEEIILFSNTIPIATPDGIVYQEHGEASGATVTNGGETCCNEEYDNNLQQRLAFKCEQQNISYKIIGTHGNGDDGITYYFLDDLGDFEIFQQLIRDSAEEAAQACGFRIQKEKWDIFLGTYGKYCQYLIDWDGKKLHAYYPAALILNSIINPEKEYTKANWDKDYRDLDIIQKLDNGRELPYFHQLIDFVDNGMKYHLLGSSEEETARILSKWDKYRAQQDGTREFNRWGDGYKSDIDYISTSPTVQYLLKKRGIIA